MRDWHEIAITMVACLLLFVVVIIIYYYYIDEQMTKKGKSIQLVKLASMPEDHVRHLTIYLQVSDCDVVDSGT